MVSDDRAVWLEALEPLKHWFTFTFGIGLSEILLNGLRFPVLKATQGNLLPVHFGYSLTQHFFLSCVILHSGC